MSCGHVQSRLKRDYDENLFFTLFFMKKAWENLMNKTLLTNNLLVIITFIHLLIFTDAL